MTPGMRALLAVIIGGILIAAWMSRYQTIYASDVSIFLTDRWTGTVYWCALGVSPCKEVPPR
jgi:hypothetical protein